ncbi:PIN domain nuclease, partial [Treponema sp. OttesenSCG-928-L16]|nr:PIN domain nuclease [Treponema sp. OttesenSCG-928-L16]
IECLSGLALLPLAADWEEIAEIQYQCIRNGINKIGLVDIIIAQNARQHGLDIFSTDRHMELLARTMGTGCRKE